MSEIRVDSITDEQGTGRPAFTNGVQTSNINGGQVGGRRNLIINGAMQVAQHGTSKTGVGSGFTYDTVDRFQFGRAGGSEPRFTMTQSNDAPDGFNHSVKLECTTADDQVSSNDYQRFEQRIEGLNLGHLNFGSPAAKNITLSFFVKSNVIGGYTVTLNTSDGSNVRQRTIQYTINSSNTWEKKVFTIEGDTDSGGTIRSTNEVGINVFWGLEAGSAYTSTDDGDVWHDAESGKRMFGQTAIVGSSVGNTWQLTGVQLEVGDTATEFEHRSYGEELALCQRYYEVIVNGAEQNICMLGYYNSTTLYGSLSFVVEKRATPTLEFTSVTDGYRAIRGSGDQFFNSLNIDEANVRGAWVFTGGVSGTVGQCFPAGSRLSGTFMAFDSEL